MRIAVYPGSFDPITYGHLDIIRRASEVFDKVIVGVLKNQTKTPLFDFEERVDMIREVVKDYPNVEVVSFQGLLIEFTKKMHADVIVRGIRAVSDFEYELMMAQTNKQLHPDVETMFFATSAKYSFLSSINSIFLFHEVFEHSESYSWLSSCTRFRYNINRNI